MRSDVEPDAATAAAARPDAASDALAPIAPLVALDAWGAFAARDGLGEAADAPASADSIAAVSRTRMMFRAKVIYFVDVLAQVQLGILKFLDQPDGIAVDAASETLSNNFATDDPLRGLGSGRAQSRTSGVKRQKVSKHLGLFGATCWMLLGWHIESCDASCL